MVLEINSENDIALSRKGAVLTNLGKHEDALEVFNQAIEINPKNDYALSSKGIALVNLGKHEEALEVINQAIEINPRDDIARLNKGAVLINLGKHEEALEVFNRALEINPKNDYTLLNKGVGLTNLGKHEEALEVFNQAIKINPKNDIALLNKGAVLINLGKYEEALEALNMVLEINPKYRAALRNKAAVLLKLEKYKEGVEVAKETLDVATKEQSKIDAMLIIIEAYIALNRRGEAALEMEKIKGKMADKKPDLVEYFVEICFNLAIEELKDGNRGNADKFIKMAFENSSKLETDIIKELTMNFLKDAAESGEMQVIKAAAEEILDQQKDEFTGLLRPITKAIEIIETKDLKKYYDLQIEEREIVVDVVRKITKSDELVPDELKRKEAE